MESGMGVSPGSGAFTALFTVAEGILTRQRSKARRAFRSVLRQLELHLAKQGKLDLPALLQIT
jgi:hypothetical protein